MQQRFRADFSDVRIHTDANAIQMNHELKARAFTVGNDIYFNRGQYQPSSERGLQLLAHELVHVRQQRGDYKAISKQEEEEAEPGSTTEEPETTEVEPEMPDESETEPLAEATADPCTYRGRADKRREVHLNLGLRAIRVYTKTSRGFRYRQFNDIIIGSATFRLAANNGWCHMYPVIGHQRRTSHGLINFLNYCGEFGFHSNFWHQPGGIQRIPGAQSAGCARLHDADASSTGSGDSAAFYNLVRDGDCVRLYHRSFWRTPTFKRCRPGGDCTL
jgi:hypothetical protein